MKILDLSSDTEGKTWCFSDGQIALKCRTWSHSRNSRDEDPDQSGMRLSSSLTMLKKLCKVNDCNVIIDVGINRNIEYRHQTDKHEYLKYQVIDNKTEHPEIKLQIPSFTL